MSIRFDPQEKPGESLLDWWQNLQSNSGDRAELRRAKSVTEVILLPAFHKSASRFRPFFPSEEHWESRMAAVLGLLAHVRHTSNTNLAASMATPKAGGAPAVSVLRFRRLLLSDREGLYVAMIRVLRMLDNSANPHDLANSVYYWGDKVKRRWAFDYYPNITEKTPD